MKRENVISNEIEGNENIRVHCKSLRFRTIQMNEFHQVLLKSLNEQCEMREQCESMRSERDIIRAS